jgi:hypothetical protein
MKTYKIEKRNTAVYAIFGKFYRKVEKPEIHLQLVELY